jgi:glycogen operon protein
MNAYVNPLDFRIPASPSGRPWRRLVDTALASPDDVVQEGSGPPVPVLDRYRVQAHSTIILVSEE